MKKFLLLFVMLSGMMMSHEMLAINTEDSNLTFETSDGGKTITITSTKAGALAGLKFNGSHNQQLINALAASSGGKMVFVGDFCEADLKFLNGQGQHNNTNYCTQKTVDMSEAKFVAQGSSSANTYLYHSEADKQNKNEGDYCVVDAKKYVSAPSRSWISIQESDIPSDKNIVLKSQEEFASYVNNNYEEYIKVPKTYRYYKMVVTYENNNPIKTWVLVEDESSIPSNATIKNADFDESNLNNRTDYCNDGEYIRFGATFDYYTNPVTFIWQDASGTSKDYSNGDTSNSYYQSLDGAPAPTDEGQSIIVGGTEYIFHNGQWVDPSQVGGSGNYDYTKMKFDYWKNSVEEITTSKYAEGRLADQLCTDCSNLKTLTLSAGDFALAGTVLGNNINSLETVNIKKGVTTLSLGMFNSAGTSNNVQHFETLNFEDGCQIKTIPAEAFANTGIKNLTIPSSVEEIQGEAFHSCYNLETVTFVNTNKKPLIIKNRAFQNSQNIKDVYVNVKFSDRHMICEYNAFDFKGMEGQTVADSEMTTLHFPEENFDYYAGEWKKGMSIKQSDLNAFKDGLDVTYNGQEYIKAPTQDQSQLSGGFAQVDNNSDGYYHPSDNSKKYAPANGWQQFAKTASPREVVIPGNVYMTYSTATPYSLPSGIIAFRVTDYVNPETENGKTKNGTLVLKQIDQVPTETGMLLISTDQYLVKPGENNSSTADVPSKFYFGDPVGTPQIYHYTMGQAGDATSNYLAPAVHGIEVGPVSKGEPNAVTGAIDVNGTPFDHRNFAMNKSTHQFVRVKHITMPDNRAFLSLPITKFTNNNESDIEGPKPTQTVAGLNISDYNVIPTASNGAKATLVFDYDVEKYGMIWPLVQKEDVTDGIDLVVSNSNAERVQEGIFTLQGVKVAQPTEKGIYIVNGKKVIIK